MPQVNPMSFLNSRGESLIRVTSGTTRDLVEVEYDDVNAPLTMKLTTNDLIDNLSCPSCGNGDEERIHWKRLQLTCLSTEVGTNPFVFPLEISSPETHLVSSVDHEERPAWRIDEENADEMTVRFREHPPLVILREVSIPVLFRSRFFKVQARLELQCQGCNDTWFAWQGVIAVYDPIIFRQSLNVSLELHSFSRTLEMMTITPRVDGDSLAIDNDFTRTTRHLPSHIIGFYMDVTVSVPPDSIPTLAEPLPLHFLLNTSHNRSYARHFMIFNVTPSSWKPTPQEPKKTVRILIGLRYSTRKNDESRAFLQRICDEGEQTFTLRIEGPLQQGHHPRVDVDVILEPSTLQAITNQLERSSYRRFLRLLCQIIENEILNISRKTTLVEDVQQLEQLSAQQKKSVLETLFRSIRLETRPEIQFEGSHQAPIQEMGRESSFRHQEEKTIVPYKNLLRVYLNESGNDNNTQDIKTLPSKKSLQQVLVLGRAGSGKTTLSLLLTREMIKLFENSQTPFIPLRVTATTLANFLKNGKTSTKEILTSIVNMHGLEDETANLDLFNELPVSWMVDGWDELTDNTGRELIIDFLSSRDFILFSRPEAREHVKTSLNVTTYDIRPISSNDAARFFHVLSSYYLAKFIEEQFSFLTQQQRQDLISQWREIILHQRNLLNPSQHPIIIGDLVDILIKTQLIPHHLQSQLESQLTNELKPTLDAISNLPQIYQNLDEAFHYPFFLKILTELCFSQERN